MTYRERFLLAYGAYQTQEPTSQLLVIYHSSKFSSRASSMFRSMICREALFLVFLLIVVEPLASCNIIMSPIPADPHFASFSTADSQFPLSQPGSLQKSLMMACSVLSLRSR